MAISEKSEYVRLGLCDAVRVLSMCLLEQLPQPTARQRLLVTLLGLMPTFAAARRLDRWEGAFLDAQVDEADRREPQGVEHDLHEKLIDCVFELGRYNLYSRFDPTTTAQVFAAVQTQLGAAGIVLPALLPPTDW